MACPARSVPASCAAVSLAVPQNTGSISAGTKRATASSLRSVESAARPLDRANTSRMATNSGLRGRWASTAVSGGPKSITVKANRVTSRPAAEMDICRSRARLGNRPTMRNSVVTMRNAEKARIATLSVERGAAAGTGLAKTVMEAAFLEWKAAMLLILRIPIPGVFSSMRGIRFINCPRCGRRG